MRRRELILPPGVSINTDFVDMGTAGIWAACNIGATRPEEYGMYFAWGETDGFTPEQIAIGERKFDITSYKWSSGKSISDPQLTKYNKSSSYGLVDNKVVLDLEDDAAYVLMGENWRMPTDKECSSLISACNKSWTSLNGIVGCMLTLKSDPAKQLFFPASGSNGKGSSEARCWSKTLNADNRYAQMIMFQSSQSLVIQDARYVGLPIRGIKIK